MSRARGALAFVLLAGCGSLPPLPPREAPARKAELAPRRPPLAGHEALIDEDAVAPIATQKVPIDLETTLRIAGASAPELERARARLQHLRAQADRAGLMLLPGLSLGARGQREEGRIVSSTGDVPSDRSFWFAEAGVALHYLLNPLEAWFDRIAALRAAEAETAATEVTRQEAERRAAGIYVELQVAHARATLARTAQRAAQEHAALLRQRIGAGLLAPSAVADAALVAARRERERAHAEAGARQASVRLAEVLRLDPLVTLVPRGPMRPFALVDPDAPVETLLSWALRDRQELRVAAGDLASSDAAVSAAGWGAFGPTLALSAFAGGAGRLAGSPFLLGPEGFDQRTTLAFGLVETISGETLGNLGIRHAELSAAELEVTLAAESVRAQLVAAWTACRDALVACASARAEVLAARSAQAAASQLLAAGLQSGVELLVRTEALAQARLAEVEALGAWNRAQVELLFALGGMGPL
jgi:outer membrane protein TolC